MPRSGAITREKIIDSAEALVYAHGFAATSLDRVIERSGITKGAFFYHFKSKAEMGRALVERYAERDLAQFDRTMGRAEKLSRDPRQQVLIFIGLLQEAIERLPQPVPGCLFASYLYEPTEYPGEVAEIVAHTFAEWRRRYTAKLHQAFASTAPGSAPPDLDNLADMLLALTEGGYVLAKAKGSPQVMIDLLGHYRAYLELLLGVGTDPAGKGVG